MAVKKIVNIPDTKPPMQIIGKNNTLNVNLEVQDINIKGKDYKCRLISVSKDLEVLPKWIDKVECYNWIYKFKIFECEFKYILFTLGYENQIIKTDTKN
jgi:hypothetical protein